MDLLLNDSFSRFPLYTSDLGCDVGMFPQNQLNTFNPVQSNLSNSNPAFPTLSSHLHSPLNLQSPPLCDKPSPTNAILSNITDTTDVTPTGGTATLPLSLVDGFSDPFGGQIPSEPSPPFPSHINLTSPSALALPQFPSTAQSVTKVLPVVDKRRSGRPVVPSKRLEAMQEIGSNVSKGLPLTEQLSDKENLDLQEPEWTRLAREYLLTRDLGSDWQECVNAWLELEARLGYGNTTRTKFC